jgi:hypothetical protein
MGYIYRCGTILWMGFTDAAGREKQEATGFVVGQEAKARRKLARTEASVAAEVARGALGARGAQPQREAEPLSVAAYAAEWSARRIKVGIVTAPDEAGRLRDHALPEPGELPLWGVRPHHIRDLVLSLRGGKLAPRTVRHVYGALHTTLKDAVADELVDTNPCILKHGDLPLLLRDAAPGSVGVGLGDESGLSGRRAMAMCQRFFIRGWGRRASGHRAIESSGHSARRRAFS